MRDRNGRVRSVGDNVASLSEVHAGDREETDTPSCRAVCGPGKFPAHNVRVDRIVVIVKEPSCYWLYQKEDGEALMSP
jgi:hypothetical protein